MWTADRDGGVRAGRAGDFISCVVLAAGRGARIGRPKQLLTLGDRCLLQHVIDQAAASCVDEIVLVLGHRAAEIRDVVTLPCGRPARIVVNRAHARGQSTSLRAGLRAADRRATAAAILLGDQPGVRASVIDTVARAFVCSGMPAARPLHTARDGRHRVAGHPVFLRRELWPRVERLRGDRGARALLASHPDWLLEVQVDGPAPGDIDTWGDYRNAQRARAPGERQR